MKKKIALIMGNRLSKWHVEVFEDLAQDFDIKAFTTSKNIFPTNEIKLPMEIIYYENEHGSYVYRKFKNLKYRILRRKGYRIKIDDFSPLLEGFDVLHTWELHPEWSFIAAKAKKRYGNKLVVTFWDTIPFNLDHLKGVRERKDIVISSADRFVVYTNKSKEALLLEGVSHEKICMINPCVDTDRFKVRDKDEELLRRFGLSKREIIILFVGRLVWEKGIYDLVYSFKQLVQDNLLKDFTPRLLVIGNGPERNNLDMVLSKLGIRDKCIIIEYFPYTQMHKIYNLSDIFVLPSISTSVWQEQFGMAALEAMASGVPIVSSDSGAMKEIIAASGEVIPQHDFNCLGRVLKKLVLDRDSRGILSDKARSRAVDEFSLTKAKNSFQQMYERAI